MWMSARIEDRVFKWAKRDPQDADHREIPNELLEYEQKLADACRAWSSRAEMQVPEEERLRSLQALGYAR
jgi:hypothetical protein